MCVKGVLTRMVWHAGAGDTYTGEAVNPKNLSWFEGIMGVGRPYKKEVQRRKSKEIAMRTQSQKAAFNGQAGSAASATCAPAQQAAQPSPENPVRGDESI